MKKPILIAILLFACANVGVFLGYYFSGKPRHVAVSPHAPPNRQAACGPLCLRIAANLYGIPCDEARALSLCPPEPDGTRISVLQKAAPKFGMKANTAQLTWDKLMAMRELAILHVNDNHYVLANPQEQTRDKIRIYDYELAARWYDKESLEAIWKGTSLVLAKDQDFKSPSLISSPTYWHDEGSLEAAEDGEYSFIIQNASEKPIELTIDSTSCQCSSAILEREQLEPGEETTLTATVKLENKRGGFRERVVVLSTCGDQRSADSFILAGTVIRCDILSTGFVFVGATHRGGTIGETSFVIHDQGNGELKHVEAALKDSVSWLNPKFICEKVSETNQQKARKFNAQTGDWLVTVSADITKDAPIHNFKIPIIVKTNLPASLDTLTVLLEGEIVPAIGVEPAALIFSEQSREQPKTLRIKALVPSLQIPEPHIRVKDNVSLLCVTERMNEHELFIEVRLNVGDNLHPATFAGDIELDFGNEGMVNVPVVYQTSRNG